MNDLSSCSPDVSVILPVYNGGIYLKPALFSILNQSYRNLEVLLVDDGSTDGSVDGLQDIPDERIRLFKQANAGKSVALNHAINHARGKYYAIQDGDDISHPERIERQVHYLEANNEIAGLFCGHNLIIGNRRYAPLSRFKGPLECRKDIERMAMPAHDPTAMYRMSIVREIEYDPKLWIGEGLDYILRIGERYPLAVLGKCLYAYRINPYSLSRHDNTWRLQMIRNVIEKTARRRGILMPDQPHSSTRRHLHGVVSHFMDSVLDQKKKGRFPEALKTAVEGICLEPGNPSFYKPLVYALTPSAVVDAYRRRKYR